MKKIMKRIYSKDRASFMNMITACIVNKKKTIIVTANPEIIMKSQSDEELEALLSDPHVEIVADGIGVVKAYEMMGLGSVERIPGVEIVEALFKISEEQHLQICILGSKQEVLDKLLSTMSKKYPHASIHAVHGYVKDKDAVMEDFICRKADIILVALGVPIQEKLIYRHFKKFDHGIFIGIGGSLDVLSGVKKRAPNFFVSCNLEWLYRIVKEPTRLKRFYESNVKFIMKVKKEKRMNK